MESRTQTGISTNPIGMKRKQRKNDKYSHICGLTALILEKKIMNPYLEALEPKLTQIDLKKLFAIDNPNVHEFIAKASDLCNADKLFICGDSAEDIAYVRRQAITMREEHAILSLPGHTVHFDGLFDQGRDRQNTKYLVPRGMSLSKALNQIDRQEGLAEVKGLLEDSMKGHTMIVRFISLGPANSLFTILGLQCTDSWYVAHSEDLLYRPGFEQFVKAGPKSDFLRVLHSSGKLNADMASAEYEKKRIYIDNMDNTIYSVNTQYAGNSVGYMLRRCSFPIVGSHPVTLSFWDVDFLAHSINALATSSGE